MTTGDADITIKQVCRGAFDGETLVEANIAVPEARDLTFFAEAAPSPFYDDAPTDDAGLKDAISSLQATIKARDADTYWNMHRGLRAAAAADGMPENMMRMMINVSMTEGEATFNDNLTFTPVMDGRVGQVFTAPLRRNAPRRGRRSAD